MNAPGKSDTPTAEGYAGAAWLLMTDVASMRAVAHVEAGREGAFFDDGRPVVLFERHLFHRLTDGRWDREAPDLSNPTAGGYGAMNAQHDRLAAAAQLDRMAALKATSWGLFQILGLNYAAAGYTQLQRFINAMYRSADDHLRAFVMFIRHDPRLVDAIRSHDWVAFAFAYNGPAYARNHYDSRMAEAYAALAGHA